MCDDYVITRIRPVQIKMFVSSDPGSSVHSKHLIMLSHAQWLRTLTILRFDHFNFQLRSTNTEGKIFLINTDIDPVGFLSFLIHYGIKRKHVSARSNSMLLFSLFFSLVHFKEIRLLQIYRNRIYKAARTIYLGFVIMII